MSAADWALLIAAVFWAILVLFLALVSVRLARVLESTTRTLDEVREQAVPILAELRTTVASVNQNLRQTETVMASATKIAGNAERVSTLVDRFVSLPLVKAISWGHGIQKGIRRFRGEA